MKKSTFLLGLFFVFYCLFVIFKCTYLPFSSDMASYVLETNDILQGNFLLSGWWLQPALSVTTDFLFFLVGDLFCGISVYSHAIAVGLMISTTVIIGFFMCRPASKSALCFYFFICAIPCMVAVDAYIAHLGTVICSFIAIYFTSKEFEQHQSQNLIIIGSALFLGCFGDDISILVGVFPILIYCIASIFSKHGEEAEPRICKRIILVIFIVIILIPISTKLYLMIGQASKTPTYASRAYFDPISKLGEKLVKYIISIFQVADADFFGKAVFGSIANKKEVLSVGIFSSILNGNINLSIKTPAYFIHALVIMSGLVISIKNIRRFICNDCNDAISTLLSIGILCASIVFSFPFLVSIFISSL